MNRALLLLLLLLLLFYYYYDNCLCRLYFIPFYPANSLHFISPLQMAALKHAACCCSATRTQGRGTKSASLPLLSYLIFNLLVCFSQPRHPSSCFCSSRPPSNLPPAAGVERKRRRDQQVRPPSPAIFHSLPCVLATTKLHSTTLSKRTRLMLPRVSVVIRAAYQSTGQLSPATNLGAKRVRARPPPHPTRLLSKFVSLRGT